MEYHVRKLVQDNFTCGNTHAAKQKRKQESMKCPECNEHLVPVRRGNILVNICPDCRGAWLERMHVDEVLALFSREAPEAAYAAEGAYDHHRIDEERQHPRHRLRETESDDDEEHYRGRTDEYGRQRKRGGLLGNIMEMFGG